MSVSTRLRAGLGFLVLMLFVLGSVALGTVSVLSRSRRWPVPEAPPPSRTLLDAFGGVGPR